VNLIKEILSTILAEISKSMKLIYSYLLLLILIISTSNFQVNALNQNYEKFLNHVIFSINIDNIKRHYEYLSSIKDTYSGYPGYYQVTSYIYHYVKEILNLNVKIQNYSILIPYDYNSTLTIIYPKKIKFRVYALIPNLIEIYDEKLCGEIIYLRKGDLEELKTANLTNKIILLDFDSDTNWIYLKMFGALAVIFIKPKEYSNTHLITKVLKVPLKFPRAIIEFDDFKKITELLRKGKVIGELNLKNEWKKVNLSNILVFLPSTHKNENLIMVAIQYDTYSQIPMLSHNPNTILNIATVLELLRILKNEKLTRPLVIGFFSGTANSMAGARYFLRSAIKESSLYNDEIYSLINKIRLVFTFDLSINPQLLLLLAQGNFYGEFDWNRAYLLREIANNFINYITSIGTYEKRKIYLISNRRYYVRLLPTYFKEKLKTMPSHLSEIFNYFGIFAITFYSQRVPSKLLNYKNIKLALEFSYFLIYCFLKDTSQLAKEFFEVFHNFPMHINRLSLLKGRVYLPKDLPHESLNNYLMITYISSLRHSFIVGIDKNGTFEIFGLKMSLWWYLRRYPYNIYTFIMNSNGRIMYTSSKIEVVLTSGEMREVNITLFKCGMIVIYGTLSCPLPSTYFFVKDIEIINSINRNKIDEYNVFNYSLGDTPLEQVMIIFAPINIKLDLLFIDAKTKGIVYFLRNLTLTQGETIELTPCKIIENFIKSIEVMLSTIIGNLMLKSSLIFVSSCYQDAIDKYKECINKLYKCNGLETYTLIYQALSATIKAYRTLKNTCNQIIIMNLILLFLLIPFAFMIEELVFTKRSLKKIIHILSIISLIILALVFIYPGFRLHRYLPLTFVSIVSLSTCFLSLLFIISENYRTIEELEELFIGKHRIKVPFLGLSIAIINVSIKNMRKRYLRTILTLLTVTLIVISMVLLTSWKFSNIVIMREIKAMPFESGLLIKELPIGEGSAIPFNLLSYIKGYMKNCEIYPRARIFIANVVAKKTNERIIIKGGVIGLKPNDPISLTRALIKGLWIKSGVRGIVISDELGKVLEVKIGDKILLNNEEFTIIGIISSEIFQEITDIDGIPITPQYITQGGIIQETTFIIIAPFDMISKIENTITSILIKPKTLEKFLPKVKEISQEISTSYQIYYSNSIKSYIITCIMGYEVSRTETFIIPITLACLILSNSVASSVYERRKEIDIYASLGLSPKHVVLLTLTEGIAYSTIGTMIGYIIALTVAYITSLMGYQAPIDISSPILPITLVLSILAIVVASIYPSLKAYKRVTPSLKRKWEITTKPLGNKWYIPLPFRISSLIKAKGLMNYLLEYFEKTYPRDFRLIKKPKLELKENIITLKIETQLAPYDACITEEVKIVASPKNKRITIGVLAELKTGKRYLWISSHRKFIDHIRKQILLWRSLSSREKEKYQNKPILNNAFL